MAKFGIGKCEYANKEPTNEIGNFKTFATTEPIELKIEGQKITKKDKELWHFLKMRRFNYEYYKHCEERQKKWLLGGERNE